MTQRLIFLLMALGAMFISASCSSPTPTTAPALPTATMMPPTATAAPTATRAPSPTPMATSDNCIACHTSKGTLEKLAEKKVEKSDETAGEG